MVCLLKLAQLFCFLSLNLFRAHVHLQRTSTVLLQMSEAGAPLDRAPLLGMAQEGLTPAGTDEVPWDHRRSRTTPLRAQQWWRGQGDLGGA